MEPVTMAIIGTAALEIYGNYKANSDEAKAHRENAAHAEQIAEYNAMATERELEVYASQFKRRQAATSLAYGASGVEQSGSVLDQLAFSNQVATQEMSDIALKGQMAVDEVHFQADRSNAAADAASDPLNNLLQAGGTALTAYSRTV